jgi:5-methylcytosine-specific restriction protein A
MGLAAFKPCGHPNCPALVKAGMCERHAEQDKQRQYETKKNDTTWMLYQEPRYKRFRIWFWRANPQCQLIADGKRCERPAQVLHHRRGLRSHNEDLCNAEHCVSLCQTHHHHHDGDLGTEVYSPTVT